MRRLALSALPALAAISCAPVYDVDASWTVEGADPAAACASYDAPVIRFTVESREEPDPRQANVVETIVDASCDDGSAVVPTGSFARILADLVDGDLTVGFGAPTEVNPGSASSGFANQRSSAEFDIGLVSGALATEFFVVGESCGDAGASSFTVTIKEVISPNVAVTVVDTTTVPCSDGRAILEHRPVTLGVRYLVEAATTVGDVRYTTSPLGTGVIPRGPRTVLNVELAADLPRE
jgi:hypothetical protein